MIPFLWRLIIKDVILLSLTLAWAECYNWKLNLWIILEVYRCVEELLYLIECRTEGEKFVISSYRWSVQMLQEQYDNRDNLERLQFLVWDEGKVQFED